MPRELRQNDRPDVNKTLKKRRDKITVDSEFVKMKRENISVEIEFACKTYIYLLYRMYLKTRVQRCLKTVLFNEDYRASNQKAIQFQLTWGCATTHFLKA